MALMPEGIGHNQFKHLLFKGEFAEGVYHPGYRCLACPHYRPSRLYGAMATGILHIHALRVRSSAR